MQRLKYFRFIRPSTVSCLFIPKAQLRLGPRLGLDPNSLPFCIHLLNLGDTTVILCRLSSEAWHSSMCMLIIALISIGFIILDMSCELFFYV